MKISNRVKVIGLIVTILSVLGNISIVLLLIFHKVNLTSSVSAPFADNNLLNTDESTPVEYATSSLSDQECDNIEANVFLAECRIGLLDRMETKKN